MTTTRHPARARPRRARDRRGLGPDARAPPPRRRPDALPARLRHPLPDGFGGTIDEYRDWLVAELEAIGRPVDLVGHDWGGGHVVNVAMAARPPAHLGDGRDRRLRPGVRVAPDRPDAGRCRDGRAGQSRRASRDGDEAHAGDDRRVGIADGRVASRHRRGARAGHGARDPRALPFGGPAGHGRPRPGPRARRGPARPVLPRDADHPVGSDERRRAAAARAGARVVTLDGRGHWWLLAGPRGRALGRARRFWRGLNLLNDTQAVAA